MNKEEIVNDIEKEEESLTEETKIKEKKEKKEKKHKINDNEIKLQKELIEISDKFLREKADNINYRRRKEEELNSFKKFANENIIKELIETVDDLERAIKLDDNDLTDDLSKMLEGFKMVYSNLMLKLEKFGVKMVNPINEKFDPNYHQALLTDKVDNLEPDMVIEVLQKGYLLYDRVIRPAMVKVSV